MVRSRCQPAAPVSCLVRLVAVTLLSAACSDGSGAKTLQSIGVTPSDPSLAAGMTVQLAATASYSDHSTQDLTSSAAWTSSDPTVAAVSTDGLVTAGAPGSATITAASGGVSGSSTVTVTAATLQSIAVTPPAPSIARGTTQQFVATGTFSNGSTQDLTNQATWASSNPAIGSVSDSTGSKGLGTGVAVGTATVSATLSGVTGSTSLTVTAATLQSIAVTPAAPSVAKGKTAQFAATGTYSDNSTQDITSQVTWASSVATVASISNAAGSKGLASTLLVGATNISATLSGKSGGATLTVTAAILQSIAVTPSSPSRPVPLTLAFTATGTFTDGTTQNVTTQVTWSSSNVAVASISNAAGSIGVATAVTQGNSTIRAALGALSGSTVFTVTGATLSTISVAPSSPSIAKGTSQQFTATGHYSDGSSLDLTQPVTWASSATAVATISNAAGSKGKASAVTVGTSTISAAFGGKTGSTLLTVTPATLVSLAVTPASPSIARGLTQQFVATGTFSDGSTQVLTSAVTWSSSDIVVASIANAGSVGLATALSVGTSNIRAALGTVTGSASLRVTDAILVSIAVSPATVSIPRTHTEQFTALGTYSDSSELDLTTQVTWASSSDTVVVISNAALSQGLATALAKGKVTITATQGTVSGTASATVP